MSHKNSHTGKKGELNSNKSDKYRLDKLSRSKILSILFVNMFQISCFTFGGGFVIVNFLKKRFVDKFGWLDDEEMIDMTAIAQASPGAIAVNAAILVGTRIAGFAGMSVSVLAMIMPPIIILSIVSYFYLAFSSNPYFSVFLSGMQAAVAAIIFDLVFSLFGSLKKIGKIQTYVIFVLTFIAAFMLKINVVYLVLISLLIGISKAVYAYFQEKNNS